MNTTVSASSLPLLKKIGTPGSRLNLDEPIFHYTSAAGACSILHSKKLWASNAKYLNDSSELQLAYNMAFKAADERLKNIVEIGSNNKQSVRDATRELLCQIKESMKNGIDHPSLDVYVTCFSLKDDVLSQRRGYSDGGGFSIGINPKLLKSSVSKAAASMGSTKSLIDIRRVSYSHEAWINDVVAAIDSLIENARKRVAQENGIDVARLTERLCSAFSKEIARAAPYIKDNGFKEEQEIRLAVYTNASSTLGARQFRTAGSAIIPHLSLCIGDSLESVRVGPRQDHELQIRAIKLMNLKPVVNLFHSTIPFRT